MAEITPASLKAALPILVGCRFNPEQREAMIRLLAGAIGAYTDNRRYARDTATLLYSVWHNELFTALPVRLRACRASAELFMRGATVRTMPTYIRSIASAAPAITNPGRFRKRLIGRAKWHKLAVPEELENFDADLLDAHTMVRLTKEEKSDALARAEAMGFIYERTGAPNISAYIRYLVSVDRQQLETAIRGMKEDT